MATLKKPQKKSGFLQPLIDVKNHLDSIHLGIGKDRDYFIQNLSMLTSSGMGVISALDAIIAEVQSRDMRKILKSIRQEVEGGAPLWRTLQQANIFPGNTITLLRIGEESGKLSENLKLVGAQQEKERIFRSQLRAAMLYPMFVLSLTVFIGVGIAWFVLPKLALVFSQLNIELPWVTRVLLVVGRVLGEYGQFIVPGVGAGMVISIYFLFFFPKTKFIGLNLVCQMPIVKRLIQELEMARFGYLLGTLLQAGIQVTQALESLEKASGFPYYQKLYAHLRQHVDDGDSFQKSFASYKKSTTLVPRPVQQLIISGEQSGNLIETLMRISSSYEQKTETTTKNLTVILEPILLVIVWLGVLGVATAVIMPVYGLIGGLSPGG